MPFEFIRTESRDAVFTIVLRREPVNVLHVPMMREIGEAVERAEVSQDPRDRHHRVGQLRLIRWGRDRRPDPRDGREGDGGFPPPAGLPLARDRRAQGRHAGVQAFAGQFARHSRPVLHLMMKTLRQARAQTLESGFDPASRIYLDELLPLQDVQEGLDAYAQKRAPRWMHR